MKYQNRFGQLITAHNMFKVVPGILSRKFEVLLNRDLFQINSSSQGGISEIKETPKNHYFQFSHQNICSFSH